MNRKSRYLRKKGLSKTLAASVILVVIIAVLAGTYLYFQSGKAQTATTQPQEAKIVVTDAYGRNVELPANVERVIITGKGARIILEAAYAFTTAPKKIVAIDSYYTSMPLIHTLDKYLNNKTIFEGGDVSVEELLALNPDVIVLKSYMRPKLGTQLEDLGATVVYLDLETPDAFFRDFMTLGKIFGEEDRAQQLVNYMQSLVDYVTSKTSALAPDEKPKVLFLYYSTKGGTIAFKVPGQNWIQNKIIELAGGISVSANLSGSGWNVVNLEQVIAWDPDYIFIVTYRDNPSPEDIVDKIMNDTNWQTVKAVKEGHVYAVPGGFDSWDMPTPKWVLCLLWMAKKMHPDLFADLNMAEKTQEFFMTIYNMTPEQAQQFVPEGLD